MKSIEAAIRAIKSGPKGPEIGAFFDFDGTLIDGFSAAAYITDRIKRRKMSPKEIVETFSLMRKKDLTDEEFSELIAEAVLEWNGVSETEMRELWQRLWLEKVATTIFPESWKIVQAHRKMGHTIAIASSATIYQIEPIASEFDIEHILGTRPKVRNGKLTGGIEGKSLWGQGKADAVIAFSKEHKIDLGKSYGYANGDEDIAFLSSVGQPTAVQPKPKLKQKAEDSGWSILRYPRRSRGTPAQMAKTVGAYGAMGLTFLAGMGYSRLSNEPRKAVDMITSMSSDAAFAVLGVRVDVKGKEHLRDHRPCVFLLNHQSKFDMFVMMHIVRTEFTGAAKIEARKVPGFGRFMEMADVAFLDRSNPEKAREALKPAVDRLKRGLSMCVAPEGTRSWTPKLGKFKKGPFHMAMQAGVPVVPVVIHNAWEIMGRNDQVMRAGTIRVTVLPPVSVEDWTLENMNDGIAKVRQMYLDALEETAEI